MKILRFRSEERRRPAASSDALRQPHNNRNRSVGGKSSEIVTLDELRKATDNYTIGDETLVEWVYNGGQFQ